MADVNPPGQAARHGRQGARRVLPTRNERQPRDAPFDDYELWATGSLSAHSWTRLATLEDSAGVPREGRLSGQQKFVLQDGLHCRLRGTEHKPMDMAMDFWIPVRQGRQEERTAIPGARLCQFDI